MHRSPERYGRQIKLREIGEAGQLKLSQAKVIVIGAGGLGCPALQYLAASGIGTIGIVDDDVVAIHNLHRQILYSTGDVGKRKAEVAAQRLGALNPEIRIIAYKIHITQHNAIETIREFDYVIDGSDNFETRYLVNDACVLLNKPLIYGAIGGFEGQVAIFNCRNTKSGVATNYRDLFPTPPKTGEVPNCEEAGVIGVLPGIIGMVMASEAIKLIAGYGEPLINSLLIYNLLTNQTYQIEIGNNDSSHLLAPKNESEFRNTNYEAFCNIPGENSVIEVDVEYFQKHLSDSDTMIIDVREVSEMPVVIEFDHVNIPLSGIESSYHQIKNDRVILFCQSGKRSQQAGQVLSRIFNDAKQIYSLKGGILAWKKYQTENL